MAKKMKLYDTDNSLPYGIFLIFYLNVLKNITLKNNKLVYERNSVVKKLKVKNALKVTNKLGSYIIHSYILSKHILSSESIVYDVPQKYAKVFYTRNLVITY